MALLKKFVKQPREMLDFDIAFDELLDYLGDTARAVDPVQAFAPDGITLVAAYWVEEIRSVKLWFSGGEDGERHRASFLFHTTGGRTFEGDIEVKVKEI